ncbi:hypothetical protein [Paenibacillus campi]|uniref:hypothetical protein n=1 Tax=Paenibacillus campi TaxID=3106031 RepID=UPI002AFDEE37|nr:hypothetical protein [Paenibacillus sp. SGZ-1009]
MQILINVFIIFVSALVMVLLWLALNWIFSKVLVPITEWCGEFLGRRIKRKITVLILEWSLVSLPVIYAFILLFFYIITGFGGSSLFNVLFIFCTLLFLVIWFIMSATYIEYRKINPSYEPKRVLKTEQKIDFSKSKKYYVFNRIYLLMDQIPDFLKSIMILIISLTFLTKLKWPDSFYFLLVCFAPLYANYWVYFVRIFTINQNGEEVFVRRFVAYSILMTIAVYQLFIQFQGYIHGATYVIDLNTFILTGSGVLYISLDRILKEVTVDYINFRNKKDEVTNNSPETSYET